MNNNQNNQSVKAAVIDNIIVAMSGCVASDVLQILEQVLVDEFTDLQIERMQTLPMEMKDSIDEQNCYIIKLFQYKKKNLKEATRYGYLLAVKRLVTVIYKPLTRMDEVDIYHYLNWYEDHNTYSGGKKNSAITINNERRFLSAFFSWMRKEKLITENPVYGVEPLKTVRKPIDYFSDEEMAKLRDGCRNLRDRAMMEVMRSTGARVGEIAAITIDMVDFATGDIMICGERGDRYRPIFLDAEARHHCRKYLDSRTDDTPALFVQLKKPHSALTPCGMRMAMKEIAKQAGVTSRVYPHKMRKTLGMDLKNRGVDIGTIQEILGHASPSVTANYYAQSTPDTLRTARKRAA